MTDRPLTLADIEGAERLAGLAYSPSERAQLLRSLDEQIGYARMRRAVRLPQHAPMATRFDPRPPGFRMPAAAAPPRFSDMPDTPLPDRDEDIAFAPLPQLSAWIRAGRLSSRRLTGIYLSRIADLNAALHCFATVTPDLARAEAEAADRLLAAGVWLGPLHGIPYGLKDLFDTRGIVTGWGAEPYRERVPDQDATIVTRLRAAGAVLLGKTTLGALAYGDIWYGGTTRNPWNLNEGSSGSSAGSASATAAGLCAFSIGTETLGSITSPSQRCGTTGLRPTFGRVARTGGMVLAWTLDKIGPICRGVEDTAIVLAAINGADRGDPSSIAADFSFDSRADWRHLRVGFLPRTFAEGATEVELAALQAIRDLGLAVCELTLPDLPYDALYNILNAEAAAAFEDLTLDDLDDSLTWQHDEAWPNTFRKSRFLSAVDHIQLDRLRWQVMLALDALFAQVDVVIGPFDTGPMLVATNFTGHPCLHLRAGFLQQPTRDRDTGPAHAPDDRRFIVPQGISLWGRLFEEGQILNLGMALERALGAADRRPTFAR